MWFAYSLLREWWNPGICKWIWTFFFKPKNFRKKYLNLLVIMIITIKILNLSLCVYKMCEDYLDAFNEVLENKEMYLKNRNKPSFSLFKFELFKYNLIKFIFNTKMFILKIIRGNFEK